MPEGYECHRCGSLHSGSPHSAITIGDGIPRARVRGVRHEQASGLPVDSYDTVYDICPGCRASFEEWFDEGQDDE